MQKVTFKEAKKAYDSGNTVNFVDGRDLEFMTLDDAAVKVSPDGTEFANHTTDWYMFNTWGTLKPDLQFYI